MKAAVEAEGALDFWRVNMRPGKPVAFGHVRGIPFMGLPGNPVSALVSFEVFARPALLKMAGRRQWEKPTVLVTLAEDVHSDGRESYFAGGHHPPKTLAMWLGVPAIRVRLC